MAQTRRGRSNLHVSDVMPGNIRTNNIGSLVARMADYRDLYFPLEGDDQYLDHLGTVVGDFTQLVRRIRNAGSHVDARAAWAAIEAWAVTYGVVID